MTSSGLRGSERQLEVRQQAVARALDDVAGQPLVEGQLGHLGPRRRVRSRKCAANGVTGSAPRL